MYIYFVGIQYYTCTRVILNDDAVRLVVRTKGHYLNCLLITRTLIFLALYKIPTRLPPGPQRYLSP